MLVNKESNLQSNSDKSSVEKCGTINSILFVTYHFPPEVGGIQTRIGKYVEYLTKKNFNVTVFFMRSGVHGVAKYKYRGADVFLANGSSSNLLNNARILTTLAISKRVDVIHVFTGSSTLLGAYCIALGKLCKAKTFISFFAPGNFDFSQLLPKTLFEFSATMTTGISTNSSDTRSHLPARFRKKTRILLGGAEPQRSGGNFTAKSDGPIILFAGRIVRRKGVDDLLEAFTAVKKKVPNAELVFVGDGQHRKELERRVNLLGLKDSVEFTGMLQGEELQKQYSRCAVAVLTSKFVSEDPGSEGLGLTLIEASMHHKPLVGTYHGGIPEVISDGVNGFLVPPENVSSISDALLRILENCELAKKMGDAAYQIAIEKFSWNAATERLLDSYRS